MVNKTDAVVVAAGRGTRSGSATPKQFLPIGGVPVVARCVDALLHHPLIRRVAVAIGPDDAAAFDAAIGSRRARILTVTGGGTRQASVAAAMDALAGDPPDNVLIHDGARPFVSAAVVTRVVEALATASAVIPAVAVADTLKRVDGDNVTETVARDGLVQAQTPQGFHFAPLQAAHAAAADTLTDDAGLMEAAGHPVRVVEGERANYKLTTADDLADAARAFAITTVGQGFDVHRLVPGGPLILGGLTLESPVRLDGHSDADVALHALTDALFGAIGDGDIGHHFPPSDPKWRGAASDQFLAYACERVRAAGEIVHLDLTVICETPKIGPVRDAMRDRIAEICSLPPESVSVKATTTERLGFTGRGEGIAAQALATVRRR
ncbi:bifunctional 2-C-methyl-D-erythritol 4-phosphate cytidylyltransferase/2-C-methyl-D-erythritol 2,4-cyclodiphosphate synthase [Acuticoccus sp. MNP-M23]|uniref:bifunctional 2-C-methyl-D-erythritol 4-phosphate cytidylyltransferase/2-C-methyl-D-erythritol 2,4-cyclodiphosphate synthase n=1 Tax=Acuticoccus sp. MNP-M23 TaxID=3072793 RepID=UPI0028159BC5|nr:bifunctional 2-C-methyl-D-erythritol 4-phosphate cytidylyltransferase/2-C-methyl-D-erythritol 2,4-cyclodiphosphate synthase [Acuticoccus sp. MNP-M23]WMS42153.1 bifunctional 2-C-methyl-D-erythritol 4-phosphate cytidylyltransferase/2-C-methyl-D-erythritol 2,4-cyclodiphosphate synthase [Acuticoccus sp. MNP-M23]